MFVDLLFFKVDLYSNCNHRHVLPDLENVLALIKNYFEQYESAFKVKLGDAGISGDLAQEFLAETAAEISSVMKKSSLEKTIAILLSDNPAQLLLSINVDAMAARLDISSDLAVSALQSIAPVVSRIFMLKSNEIIEATASFGWKPARRTIGSAGIR